MVEFEYMFFYRYESGEDGIGYYETEEEAKERIKQFKAATKELMSNRVEYGIAQILCSSRNYVPDLGE